MAQILSTAVIPEVLQLDNGGEFLGEFVQMIRNHFDTIHIVKGKARKPSTQESVERSNAPLREACMNGWKRILVTVGYKLVHTLLMHK